MDDFVERVARALCAQEGLDWEKQSELLHSGSGGDDSEYYRDQARAAIAECFKWRPIEEYLEYSTKDSRAVLGWFPHNSCIFTIWCGDDGWYYFGGGGQRCTVDPTHFMPVPEPPEQKKTPV